MFKSHWSELCCPDSPKMLQHQYRIRQAPDNMFLKSPSNLGPKQALCIVSTHSRIYFTVQIETRKLNDVWLFAVKYLKASE